MKRKFYPFLKGLVCLLLFSWNFNQLKAQCGTGNCDVCNVQLTITGVTNANVINNSSFISGPIEPSSVGIGTGIELEALGCGSISMQANLSFSWWQGGTNSWLHGVSFNAIPGWTLATGSTPGAGWNALPSIVGDCSGATYGLGFYWDSAGDDGSSNCDSFGDIDGDPSDNYGVNPSVCCPTFPFDLEFCPSSGGTTTTSLNFSLTEDGTSGGWNDTAGCDFELAFPMTIIGSSSQLPPIIGPVCEGELVDLMAESGCDTYEWSNGATAALIQVAPTATTTYCVTATSGALGCETISCTEVQVEDCCDAEAGTASLANPTPCTGEPISATVTGHNTDQDYQQVTMLVDDTDIIVELAFGPSATFNPINISGNYSVVSFNFHAVDACGFPVAGQPLAALDCAAVGGCGDFSTTPFTVVDCCSAMAGVVNASSSNECIGSATIDATASGFDANNIQALILIDQNGVIELVEMASSASFIPSIPSTGFCPFSYQVCSYNFDSGSTPPVVGVPLSSIDCSSSCCEISCTNVSLGDSEPPIFDNITTVVTVDCLADIPPAMDLEWTDNCDGTGFVSPVVTGSADCTGGNIARVWNYIDACGNEGQMTQVIEVIGDEAPTFLNPPPNITVSCIANIPPMTTLDWEDNCDGTGTAIGTDSGNADCTGGTINREWEYTDVCGNTIQYVQFIQVSGDIEPPVFASPPANITVSCAGAVPPIAVLDWVDNCDGFGSVMPTEAGSADCTGGTIIRVWEYTDACGNNGSHSQIINVEPTLVASFINAPSNIPLACGEPLPPLTDLVFDNGDPDCNNSGTISGTMTDNSNGCTGVVFYEWTGMDACGNPLSHIQTIGYYVPCEPSYSLTSTVTGILDYESSGTISSTQIITATAQVDYDSAIEIELNGGFEVVLGAVFNCFIDGCDNGGGGTNVQENEEVQKE